ncbi:peptidyl-prolyl cis-trans isomerase [Neisseriaceae bacterium ESL0693]|nr:peptidyl-prolyl cis-trans isomerase [Neisseriaceae bacterium ESL0693]
MKKHMITAVVLATLASTALAQTVVTVNGTKIDSKAVDERVSLVTKASHNQIQDSEPLRKTITSQMITHTLLVQAAKKQKLDQSPQYREILTQARAQAKAIGDDKKAGFKTRWADYQDNVLIEAYLSGVINSNPVTEDEIKSTYNELSKYYKGTQEVQLGEIMTRDANTAQQAIDELNHKQDFSTVAKKYTIDPAGREAGGIPQNYVKLKDLQDNAGLVYDAIRDLKVGQYTPAPVAGNNGIYAVFYVNNKRNVAIPDFKVQEPILKQYLQDKRVQTAIQALYQEANIK